MKYQKPKLNMNEAESAYFAYKWISQNMSKIVNIQQKMKFQLK